MSDTEIVAPYLQFILGYQTFSDYKDIVKAKSLENL